MKKSTKVWLIVASLLIIVGGLIFVISMTNKNWNFQELDNVLYTSEEKTIQTSFSNIRVDVDITNIQIKKNIQNNNYIKIYSPKYVNFNINVNNNVLSINEVNHKKWYHYILFDFKSPTIIINLSEDLYNKLEINTETGDIYIASDFTFSNINIETDTGDVTSFAAINNSMEIETDTGDVKVQSENNTCQKLNVETDTGDIFINQTNSNNIYISSNTGDVNITNNISDKLNIETDTGDVTIELSDSLDIFIETNTGDVFGIFLSNKIFTTKSDTGDIDVPESKNGGTCKIITDTGDIEIKIK